MIPETSCFGNRNTEGLIIAANRPFCAAHSSQEAVLSADFRPEQRLKPGASGQLPPASLCWWWSYCDRGDMVLPPKNTKTTDALQAAGWESSRNRSETRLRLFAVNKLQQQKAADGNISGFSCSLVKNVSLWLKPWAIDVLQRNTR